MIGQNSAVVDLGFIKLKGFFAWLFWLVIHIYFLIEFDNKLLVMIQWAWNYFTRNRGARLITGEASLGSVPIDNGSSNYPPVNIKQPLNA
jgi:NADH dehydrogenase